jgi:hypothetical protein
MENIELKYPIYCMKCKGLIMYSGQPCEQGVCMKCLGEMAQESVKIQIVHSERIDYCGKCKAEHGYDCPFDECEHGVVKKYCFRCARPDLSGKPKI